MFGTRDRGASLLLCLVISAGAHWALLRAGRVDLGPRGKRSPRSGLERLFLRLPPPRPGPGAGQPLRLLRLRESGGGGVEERPAPGTGTPAPVDERVVEPGKASAPETSAAVSVERASPFALDSLDLRLVWPWLGPEPAAPPAAERMTGLRRALIRVRERAHAARDSASIALDTKYGRFGISAEGLMLGPIVVPLPLAPYRSAARRERDQAEAEIREQGKAESMRDDDIEGQRERILEWWRRRQTTPEGP